MTTLQSIQTERAREFDEKVNELRNSIPDGAIVEFGCRYEIETEDTDGPIHVGTATDWGHVKSFLSASIAVAFEAGQKSVQQSQSDKS